MRRTRFDLVCLFGFSPHFSEIAAFLETSGINCTFIFGPRQKELVDNLILPVSVQKICIQSLKDDSFQELGILSRESLGISFGSPFIFTQEDIDNFGGQLINSHGAPLPEFKGGGGFSWRILQRDKRGALLMHYVTTQIDEGAWVFRKDFLFSDADRMPGDYEKRQLKEESEHLVPWIKKVILGEIALKNVSYNRKTNDEIGSYFPRLSSNLHGCINWELSLQDLESFVLAFSRPYPGAYTFAKGQKVNIFDFYVVRECYMHPFTYGLLLNVSPEGFMVSCNGGIIFIKHIDLHINKSNLSLKSGDRLYTPQPILEKALSCRVFYRPDGLVPLEYTLGQDL